MPMPAAPVPADPGAPHRACEPGSPPIPCDPLTSPPPGSHHAGARHPAARRRRAVLALAAAALVGHLMLLQRLQTPPPPLRLPAAPPAPPTASISRAPSTPPAPTVAVVQLVRPLPAAVPARTRQPPAAGPASSAAVAGPEMPPAARAPAAPVLSASTGPARPADTARDDASRPDPVPAAATPAELLRPPPLYPARALPPAQARYAFVRSGRQAASGEALLAWQHDGRHYQLSLQVQAGDGRPLLAQHSHGRLDGHGLVPVRQLSRGRDPRQQAVNFDWDAGRIGFSGPAQHLVAWPGVQDALSWLVQLPAVLAARPEATALELVVVDPRGGVAAWDWRQLDDDPLVLPEGPVAAARWQRLPPQADGLQVDLWLAPAGHGAAPWPLRVRWQWPRHGHWQQLDLLEPPQAPPVRAATSTDAAGPAAAGP